MPKRKRSNIDASVGLRMRYYRIQCGLTQQQVADALKINRTTYTKYETGVSEPSHELLGKIVKMFGIDYDAIHDAQCTDSFRKSNHCKISLNV